MHMGRKYPCGKCDYKASDHRSLTEHNKLKHATGEYVCGDCGYQAMEKGALTKHKKSILLGVKCLMS